MTPKIGPQVHEVVDVVSSWLVGACLRGIRQAFDRLLSLSVLITSGLDKENDCVTFGRSPMMWRCRRQEKQLQRGRSRAVAPRALKKKKSVDDPQQKTKIALNKLLGLGCACSLCTPRENVLRVPFTYGKITRRSPVAAFEVGGKRSR